MQYLGYQRPSSLFTRSDWSLFDLGPTCMRVLRSPCSAQRVRLVTFGSGVDGLFSSFRLPTPDHPQSPSYLLPHGAFIRSSLVFPNSNHGFPPVRSRSGQIPPDASRSGGHHASPLHRLAALSFLLGAVIPLRVAKHTCRSWGSPRPRHRQQRATPPARRQDPAAAVSR
jgi:hypothetical protein